MKFQQANISVFPPEFSLEHESPSEIQAQVLTPFSARVIFRSSETVNAVQITDANGTHEVAVEQVRASDDVCNGSPISSRGYEPAQSSDTVRTVINVEARFPWGHEC